MSIAMSYRPIRAIFLPRWAPALACVALALPHSVSAQSDDAVEPFLGTWSGVFTAQEDDWWTAADIACFVGCPRDMYEHLSALLADPANDDIPWFALAAQSNEAWYAEFEAQMTETGLQVRADNTPESDPKFLNCQPYGFVRQVTNPLPMEIVRDGDNLLVRYEEWALLRPIYMDGRDHPEHRTHTLLGHSIGRVEDGVLIVETERVTSDRISDETRIGHSEELTAVERYTVLDDPRRLEVTFTLVDPVTFIGQMVITQTWLYTPEVELVQDTCFQQPGKP